MEFRLSGGGLDPREKIFEEMAGTVNAIPSHEYYRDNL
jgi:hypothetical protein